MSCQREISVHSLALSIMLLSTSAGAHLDLTSPPPRLGGIEGGSQLKRGPCGQTTNGRTDRVSVFEPGQTITVEWAEYINHPSYYRIAFDVDGDDSFPIREDMDTVNRNTDDPEAVHPVGDVVLKYVYEPPDLAVYSTDVTLPDVECENCTLQVIQFMYDNLNDGRNNEYYFQCADIALRRSGSSGEAGAAGSPSGAAGAPATGGSDGSGGSTSPGSGGSAASGDATGGMSTGSADAATTTSGGSSGSPGVGQSSDSGGCALVSAPARTLGVWWLLALSVFTMARRAAATIVGRRRYRGRPRSRVDRVVQSPDSQTAPRERS
jgi:hypothetical protein